MKTVLVCHNSVSTSHLFHSAGGQSKKHHLKHLYYMYVCTTYDGWTSLLIIKFALQLASYLENPLGFKKTLLWDILFLMYVSVIFVPSIDLFNI